MTSLFHAKRYDELLKNESIQQPKAPTTSILRKSPSMTTTKSISIQLSPTVQVSDGLETSIERMKVPPRPRINMKDLEIFRSLKRESSTRDLLEKQKAKHVPVRSKSANALDSTSSGFGSEEIPFARKTSTRSSKQRHSIHDLPSRERTGIPSSPVSSPRTRRHSSSETRAAAAAAMDSSSSRSSSRRSGSRRFKDAPTIADIFNDSSDHWSEDTDGTFSPCSVDEEMKLQVLKESTDKRITTSSGNNNNNNNNNNMVKSEQCALTVAAAAESVRSELDHFLSNDGNEKNNLSLRDAFNWSASVCSMVSEPVPLRKSSKVTSSSRLHSSLPDVLTTSRTEIRETRERSGRSRKGSRSSSRSKRSEKNERRSSSPDDSEDLPELRRLSSKSRSSRSRKQGDGSRSEHHDE